MATTKLSRRIGRYGDVRDPRVSRCAEPAIAHQSDIAIGIFREKVPGWFAPSSPKPGAVP